MDNNEKDLSNLSEVLRDSDRWMLKYGMITPQKHNSVIIDLMTVFSQIKNIEYFVSPDDRKIEVILYLSTWRLILMWITFGSGRFLNKVLERLEEHFYGYAVRISLRRFSKMGVKDESNIPDASNDGIERSLEGARLRSPNNPEQLLEYKINNSAPSASVEESSGETLGTESSDSGGDSET